MYCEKCGSEIGDNSNFCAVCGAKIERKTEKSMTVALAISFILMAVGIVYVGNKKKGAIIFLVGMTFMNFSRILPILASIGIIIWAYGLYETYREVRMANGDDNPNIVEDWKDLSTQNKLLTAAFIALVAFVVLSTIIGGIVLS